MIKPPLDQLRAAYSAKNFPFVNDNKPWGLNLFGIRNTGHSNTFDDTLGVTTQIGNGKWMVKVYKGTTDPGLYWRQKLGNVKGTAILTEGYHPDIWRKGKHKQQYPALTQLEPCRVYRDRNQDGLLDKNVPTDTGVFGINMHRAHAIKESQQVDKWSAGCQVFASHIALDQVLWLVDQAIASGRKNRFSYSLFEASDFS